MIIETEGITRLYVVLSFYERQSEMIYLLYIANFPLEANFIPLIEVLVG